MMFAKPEDIMATLPTPLRASAHHGYKSWSCTWYDDQGHRRTKRFGKVTELTKTKARILYEAWKSREWKLPLSAHFDSGYRKVVPALFADQPPGRSFLQPQKHSSSVRNIS